MILEQFNELNHIKRISLNTYNDSQVVLDESLWQDYKEFLKDPNSIKIIQRNQFKYMLKSYSLENNVLKIDINRTEWNVVNYIWYRYQTNQNFKKQLLEKFSNYKFLPNSFSLHLMISSSDNLLLMCRISQQKFNDYPLKWAVTIGEQIEIQDLVLDNILERWVTRAISEEFSFLGNIDKLFNFDSLKILGLEFEDKIYNFALACNIKTYLTSSEFIKYCKPNNEIEEFCWITKDDIKHILESEDEHNYHPTTKDRLQLYTSYYNV